MENIGAAEGAQGGECDIPEDTEEHHRGHRNTKSSLVNSHAQGKIRLYR